MPEFIVFFLYLIIASVLTLIFKIPTQYLEWSLFFIIIVLGVPMLFTLPSAPFVPSKKSRRDRMIKMANLKSNDIVYELGCGDGRIIRQAAKCGVKEAIGFEISIPLVYFCRLVLYFTKNPAKIKNANIWKQDYSEVDVIFCYLLPIAMKKFKKQIWNDLKPGTRIISNAFSIPDVKEVKKEENVYLYVR